MITIVAPTAALLSLPQSQVRSAEKESLPCGYQRPTFDVCFSQSLEKEGPRSATPLEPMPTMDSCANAVLEPLCEAGECPLEGE